MQENRNWQYLKRTGGFGELSPRDVKWLFSIQIPCALDKLALISSHSKIIFAPVTFIW